MIEEEENAANQIPEGGVQDESANQIPEGGVQESVNEDAQGDAEPRTVSVDAVIAETTGEVAGRTAGGIDPPAGNANTRRTAG